MSCPAHGLAASRGMLVKGDVDLIRDTIAHMSDSKELLVVDLGSGSGTTALSVFAERANGVKIIGIESKEKELYWASVAVENIGRTKDWTPIIGDVLDKEVQPPKKVDFLMIDIIGNIRTILETWLPRMAPGGAVWIHSPNDPSVQEVISRLVSEGRFLVGTRIGSSLVGGVGLPPESETIKEEVIDRPQEREEETPPPEPETPPCELCGYEPDPNKSYSRSMRAHMKSHKNDSE